MIKYLEKSRREGMDVWLQTIDDARLLPRDDVFREQEFLPNVAHLLAIVSAICASRDNRQSDDTKLIMQQGT
jgi:hypothetical protein